MLVYFPNAPNSQGRTRVSHVGGRDIRPCHHWLPPWGAHSQGVGPEVEEPGLKPGTLIWDEGAPSSTFASSYFGASEKNFMHVVLVDPLLYFLMFHIICRIHFNYWAIKILLSHFFDLEIYKLQ